jgi:preprotein translocase subunit SecE
MARSTRQQRRQRRAQQRPALAGGPPARPPIPPVAKDDDEPRREPRQPRQPRADRQDDVRPGFPGLRFFQESVAELRKVEWPSQQQVISGTAVVLIACLITGVYLYGNDQLWSYVVKHILLR